MWIITQPRTISLVHQALYQAEMEIWTGRELERACEIACRNKPQLSVRWLVFALVCKLRDEGAL
jgi:hypothetical protein